MKLKITTLLLLITLSINAQNLRLQIGANYSTCQELLNKTVISSFDNAIWGTNLGLLYEHNLKEFFSLESGVDYNRIGYQVEESIQFVDIKKRIDTEIKLRMHYFSVPIYGKLAFSITPKTKLFIKGGSYLSMLVSANVFEVNYEILRNIGMGGKPNELKLFDLGYLCGLGFQFNRIELLGSYKNGLADIANFDNHTAKNKYFTFAILLNLI